MTPRSLSLPSIYPIVNVARGPEAALERLERLLCLGVSLLQLRAKGLPTDALYRFTRKASLLCDAAKASLIVNDRADIAFEAGASGVHLGPTDLPVRAVRRLAARMGRESFLIGATVRTAAGGRRAIAAGADYVALGPMAPSRSKRVPTRVRSLAMLRSLAAATGDKIPVVAIGGVGPGKAADLYRNGADCLAAIEAFERADCAEVIASF